MGLMQLMPATWTAMRAAYGLGSNPHDPHDNIIAGTAFLRAMYDRFGYPGLFGEYNAGPGRYAAWRARGGPLPAETRAYLDMVSGSVGAPLPAAGERAPSGLFVVLRGDGTDGPKTPISETPKGLPDRLFVVRTPD